MKSKRYIIASFLLVALRAAACGPGPFVLPDDCDLYRLMPYYAELREPADGRVEANCRAWMAAVPGVSEEAVRQAVYDFSLLDWQRVLRGDDRGNAFCRKLLLTRELTPYACLYGANTTSSGARRCARRGTTVPALTMAVSTSTASPVWLPATAAAMPTAMCCWP